MSLRKSTNVQHISYPSFINICKSIKGYETELVYVIDCFQCWYTAPVQSSGNLITFCVRWKCSNQTLKFVISQSVHLSLCLIHKQHGCEISYTKRCLHKAVCPVCKWACVCVCVCLPDVLSWPSLYAVTHLTSEQLCFSVLLPADWRAPSFVSSSEQPGPVQVLLMPNQEEEEDQATPNRDAALGQGQNPPPPPYRPPPPRPPLTLSIAHPCAPSSQGEEEDGCAGRRGEEEEDGREGTGVRLCELLQAGGVSVRPLGKHLAISLPSLPLRLWDTQVTHTSHSAHLEPTHAQPPPPPPPPTSNPPLSSPLEASGQRKPLTPLWQPPRPHSPAGTAQHWPREEAASETRHWSSWSLDRPDAVVTPYETPPDRCIPIRPQASSQNYSYSCQSSPGHYSSQHAPGRHSNPCCDRKEAEFSELDSLYQASLLAGKTGTHTQTHIATITQSVTIGTFKPTIQWN